MDRSGYSDDLDNWRLICWHGQVAGAIRGRRGQKFLRDPLKALDVMPEKRLITHALINAPPAFVPPEHAAPQVCAIGSVGLQRSVDMEQIDPADPEQVAQVFDIAHQLAQEIAWENDTAGLWNETPEQRWQRMRDWVVQHIREEVAA